jgi:anti-anti-sigma regulatory factor
MAAEIKEQLVGAIAGGGEVVVDCSCVEEADLSFLQILVAAARGAARHGVALRFDPEPSEAVTRAFERAGLVWPDPIAASPSIA